MNGFQLYKQYVSRAETATRGTADWHYGQVLTSAFYLVGVTTLFDMLEQAEAQGYRIGLVYSCQEATTPPLPSGIELVKAEYAAIPLAHQSIAAQWSYSLAY